jgi:ribosomal protein S1
MSNDKSNAFASLLEKEDIKIPQISDIVKGVVLSASKAEVRLDIDGILTGIVRGPELYDEAEEYANLKPGDEVEAMVVDEENENGELELSFRQVGQGKAWDKLNEAYKSKSTVMVRIIDANKGGLLARYYQINGFLPVSQLAPDNYPRVSGGDKSKILEKLKSFVGQDFEVNIITLDENDNKIIFNEKDVWNKKQKHVLDKYKVGMLVEGKITAVTNFGVFVSFGDNMEGLIHISELAWQRIESPSSLYKVGDKIKAEIVSIDGNKIFLSAKKIMKDPWVEAADKYKVGQTVKGLVLKVNPFGLFVKLDDDIHGLAHITQLGLTKQDKISDIFKSDEEREFEILSISPQEHRLALKLNKEGKKSKADKSEVKDEEKKPKAKKEKAEAETEAEDKTEEEAKPKAAKKAKK